MRLPEDLTTCSLYAELLNGPTGSFDHNHNFFLHH